jgi:uncharacterized membrane protein
MLAHAIARRLATATTSDMWWVGVALDAVATLAGTAGKQLLRHASVTKKWYFYPLGLVCTAVIDPAFDVSAYSFAAQSIIAPCAGMVVVWNVLLAPITLGEQMTFSRKLGALLICIGTVCVGLFGNHSEVERTVEEYLELFARPAACLYYAAFVAWSVGCLYVHRRASPLVQGFIVGAHGGSLAGNMFTTKAVVEMIECVFTSTEGTESGCETNPFLTPFPYLFIAISLLLACVSLYMLAVGLTKFEALYMITVFEGFMIISGAISGNIVMNEMAGRPAGMLLLYAGSIGIILVGLIVLLKGERRSSPDEDGVRMLQRNSVDMTSTATEMVANVSDPDLRASDCPSPTSPGKEELG